MLVLTRKTSEQIILELGDQTVFVRVVSIEGGKVRLGFDAPPSVSIHREEVYNRVQQWEKPEPVVNRSALAYQI